MFAPNKELAIKLIEYEILESDRCGFRRQTNDENRWGGDPLEHASDMSSQTLNKEFPHFSRRHFFADAPYSGVLKALILCKKRRKKR